MLNSRATTKKISSSKHFEYKDKVSNHQGLPSQGKDSARADSLGQQQPGRTKVQA